MRNETTYHRYGRLGVGKRIRSSISGVINCVSGGIGRHTGFGSQCLLKGVRVQVPPFDNNLLLRSLYKKWFFENII
jgi:hypothetical protein